MNTFLAGDKIQRNRGIGGSDAAAAIGVHPYKTKMDLYFEKTGQKETSDLSKNEKVQMGTILEPIVAELYSQKTGLHLVHREEEVWSTEFPWMYAHVDRFVKSKDEALKILEIKCTTARNRWGEPGTSQIPPEVMAQCLHNMAVTGATVVDIPVLFNGWEFLVFQVKWDQTAISNLVEKEKKFWFENVKSGVAPEPMNLDDLRSLYKISNNKSKTADQEIGATYSRYALAKDKIKDLEILADQYAFKIQCFLESDEVLLDETGRKLATWKTQTSKRFDQSKFTAENPEVAERYKIENSSRVFRRFV